jgi:hypothetical protein
VPDLSPGPHRSGWSATWTCGAEPALADAVKYLLGSETDAVVVDLSAVTFVCSTFLNFVADAGSGRDIRVGE